MFESLLGLTKNDYKSLLVFHALLWFESMLIDQTSTSQSQSSKSGNWKYVESTENV